MTTTTAHDTVGPFRTEDADGITQAVYDGELPIAVYGLGKVGLPLAAVYAEVSGTVTGVDIDEAVVDRVNRGECPFEHEPGLADLLDVHAANGALVATSDGRAAAAHARLHIVIVPVPVTPPVGADRPPQWTPEGRAPVEPMARRADLRALRAAIRDVAGGLTSGDLVVVESTVPPGTTATLVESTLARESGLDREAFGVAFSPERVASGRALDDLRGAYPKIVGGTTPAATEAATRVYWALHGGEVIPVADATTAEAVKVFEGIYRDVNIALANELARATDALGIDVREAIAAANTQPYCDIHDPGAGVGGHCIPSYPYFLLSEIDADAPLIRTARAVNDAMPGFVVEKTLAALDAAGIAPDAATVAVLGIAYRGGVPETSASPAFGVIDGLVERGARVVAVDPIVDDEDGLDVPLIDLEAFARLDPDAVVLVTAHEAFTRIDWSRFGDRAVVDARDAIAVDGLRRYVIGRGVTG